MSWARLDDGFPNNPKVAVLTVPAKWLHVVAICFCARNLTDGELNQRSVSVVLAEAGVQKRYANELETAGLWDKTGDGYQIHDYLDYNPTRQEVSQIRDARAEAGRVGGTRSGQARRQASATANAYQDASKQNGKQAGSTPYPSHPQKSKSEGFALDVARTPLLQRLVAAAGGGTEATQKVMRALGFPPPSDDELEHIIGCATGNNVRDPLAVTLAELGKIARAKSA